MDIQFNKKRNNGSIWEIRSQLYRNIQPLKDIREKFFEKYLNAKTNWASPKHFGLEPIGLNPDNSKIDEKHTYSWIHIDVVKFENRFKESTLFVNDQSLIKEGRLAI